ncbi:MAG: 4Fe-4S binding protein [Anaerolineae bacterium]
MSQTVYRQLAQRLDAIPNGFSPTESGVELRLLEKIFTEPEAELASVMRLSMEPAADIAARANRNPDETLQTLKGMARKGQIRAKKRGDDWRFGLMPFVVGIYEEQLPRMDEELASLFEQYYQEARGGGIIGQTPSVHRVIPIEEAVPFDLEIFPYEHATNLLESAKSWGVRNCICRVQRKLSGHGCDHPTENCLVFAPVEHAFDGSEINRPISKAEALRILDEAKEAGLVHSTGNYRDHLNYICNCCTCSCGIMRGVSEFGIATAVARSNFWAVVDEDICSGCEDCVERCQFDAISVPDGVAVVDYTRCVGCGQCATVCATESLHLERRLEGDVPQPPQNIKNWMLERAEERNISIFDVL